MEFLESVSVFPGWNHGLFHSAFDDLIGDGGTLLLFGLRHDPVHYRPENPVWRSCIRMAFSRLYHTVRRRSTVLLHRYSGTVSCENLYGSEAASDLCVEGKAVGINDFLTVS